MSSLLTVGGNLVGFGGALLCDPTEAPLPSHTIRCKFNAGYTPAMGDNQTLVDADENIWDISKSSDEWRGLFDQCADLLEVISANTTGVRSMDGMFQSCTSLTFVPLFDTSSVLYMSGMFSSCTSLTAVPLFDTSSTTNMAGMFYGCSLTTVPLFDTSNVTDMRSMFAYCTLTTVPLFDTSNVTNMSFMFAHCTSLAAVPLFNTSSVTNMGAMFSDCRNVESGALALYQQASGQAVPPSSHSACFADCGISTVTGAAELAQIPSDWK